MVVTHQAIRAEAVVGTHSWNAGERVMHLWMGRGEIIDARPYSQYATVRFDTTDYPSDVKKEYLIKLRPYSLS